MSVLESMRSGSDSSFMQVLLGLVVVSFIGWYAVPQGDKSSVIATVNGVKIMDTLYAREYRRTLREQEARYNRTLSNDEQASVGEQVRQQLITDEVVLQEAARMGIEVSDAEIARAEFESFKDEEGKYSEEVMTRYLKRAGQTRADFEDQLRRDMTRQKLMLLVYTASSLTEPELKSAWREKNTRVDVRYVKVNARNFQDKVAIEEGEIDQYLLENEDEVAARYQRDKSRLYELPERLELQMIRLPATPETPLGDLMPTLNTFKEEIEGGADFGELARANSQDPSAESGGLLGEKRIDQLGAEEASALADLQEGQISRVVTTPNDARLYKLVKRIPAESRELEEVRAEVAESMIREEGAPTLAATFAEEELLPKWQEAGTPPTEVLEANNLVDNTTGAIPLQYNPQNFFGPPEQLLTAVRSASEGDVLPEVYEAAGMLWVAQLTTLTEPDEATFEIERDSLVEQVLAEKRNRFLQNWVDSAKGRARIN